MHSDSLCLPVRQREIAGNLYLDPTHSIGDGVDDVWNSHASSLSKMALPNGVSVAGAGHVQ